jgi:hypothetical protein
VYRDAPRAPEERDVGPDPVWALGLFIVGILVMATGGAGNWHWVFNVGEAMLLVGVVATLVMVAITSHRQEPVGERIRRALGALPEAEVPPPSKKRRKKAA